ncbi:putative reverse transcriptase domain-containing protein, partial [Tanacetum coccineum]
EDPSSDHIPPLPATSDTDIPDTPPSLTHGTPFTKTTLSTQRSPTTSGALRRRVIVFAPGQPIPHGRPYRYHLNGLVHMMTVRKRVRPMPTHHLAVRHSVDYSSSDHFSLDDSSRDSSSSSSSESSDSSVDALFDYASSRSSSDHSLPTPSSGTRSSHHLCSLVPSVHCSSAISERPSHDSSFTSLSRKRSRSPVASVPLSLPTLRALSYACDDLLPSPKRIRSPKTTMDLEGCSEDSFEPYVPREAGLGVNFEDESSKPSRSRGTDLEIDVNIERRDKIEIDPEAIDREEIETGTRGLIEDRVTHPVVADDIPEPAQEGDVEVTYETLGDLVQRFHDHTEEIPVHRVQLEQDNRRLRDIVDVESLRLVPGGIWVTVLRLIRDYPNIGSKMLNTRSGASGTREGVNEQSDRRMAEALRARDAEMETKEMEMEEMETEEIEMEEMEMPLNFNGTEGVVGLTRLFEKMETGNVIAAEPTQLQDPIRIANNLMDQKLKGYARSDENKRRAYTVGNNEKKGYVGSLPYCNKCKTHHAGPCTVRCGNCKRVGHMTRDCKVTVTLNTQRTPVGNQHGIVCYECGRPGHFRKDCPKLKNQNCRNKSGNENGNKTENQTRGNEATAKAYAIGGGGAIHDSNVVTGTFLLNNRYASMLSNSGVDRSFVSSTFSALLDVAPSTLDTSYAIELADGRIS